jgi:hypothetical protein
MSILVRVLALAFATLPAAFSAYADSQQLRVELNTAESVQNRCRMTFLVENKRDQPIESFKLDLVVLDTNNTMQRRTLVELAPIRQAKTMVRTFDLEHECGKIGSILVNDVTVCVPGDVGACIDQLALSSRVPNIRLFK